MGLLSDFRQRNNNIIITKSRPTVNVNVKRKRFKELIILQRRLLYYIEGKNGERVSEREREDFQTNA